MKTALSKTDVASTLERMEQENCERYLDADLRRSKFQRTLNHMLSRCEVCESANVAQEGFCLDCGSFTKKS